MERQTRKGNRGDEYTTRMTFIFDSISFRVGSLTKITISVYEPVPTKLNSWYPGLSHPKTPSDHFQSFWGTLIYVLIHEDTSKRTLPDIVETQCKKLVPVLGH